MDMKKIIAHACLLLIAVLTVFCFGIEASVIPVTKFRSPDLPGGAPAGWALEKKPARRL